MPTCSLSSYLVASAKSGVTLFRQIVTLMGIYKYSLWRHFIYFDFKYRPLFKISSFTYICVCISRDIHGLQLVIKEYTQRTDERSYEKKFGESDILIFPFLSLILLYTCKCCQLCNCAIITNYVTYSKL